MAGNYSGVSGVAYSRWEAEADEPETAQNDAKIEEFYFDKSGLLVLTMSTDDGFLSIEIPIIPKPSWNSFIDSLPRWE